MCMFTKGQDTRQDNTKPNQQADIRSYINLAHQDRSGTKPRRKHRHRTSLAYSRQVQNAWYF